MVQQPEVVQVGGIGVMAFADMPELVNYIVHDDGTVFAGSAIAMNPEKVIAAGKNPQLMQLLNQADIRYADGMGVVKVMRRKLKRKVKRIPGCELWQELMAKAAQTKTPVFLVGAKPQVLQETVAKLQAMGVQVMDSQDGYFKDEDALIERIAASGAKMVTVAMGSPRQEQFIGKCQQQLPDAYYMGVGGTYDVFTGHVKRAPALWCKLHLEWAYRLLSQPSRIGRQMNLVTFVWRYLTHKV
ncbi:WecB/TagA/CpsF family glycosyltransferase [Rheinheimera marina]|uniref:WecB/TagA/CpsF family glycosyltransferase n=1 Tax=Rheinheimera marina TaxID=1774958 RepID=A0ABV9JQX6_9GAMM